MAEAELAVTHVEKIVASEGLEVIGWRDVPVDESILGAGSLRTMPIFRQLFIAGGGLGGHRPRSPRRTSCASASSTRSNSAPTTSASGGVGGASSTHDGVYFPSLSARTFVYKGMLTTTQLAPFFPDLADERVESALGARALAVLHEHVPVVAARAPVPVRRPQRRDQHGAGQPQLDGGARGAARHRPDPRRPRAHLPDLHAGWQRHDELRRSARAAAHGRLLAARSRAHDDPAAVGERRADLARAARVLPVPRVADGAVGRPGVDRLHRRHDHGRGARPQRSAPVALLGHRRRPRDHGERGRRHRRPAVEDRREGPPAARQDVPDRHHQGSHHPRRRDQGRAVQRTALPGLARPEHRARARPAGA